MANSLRHRAWTHICTKFPERQIYIRSGTSVRFFTVSPLMQTLVAGVAALCLGWVVFTTAHTVFKDQILALREEHFRRVQMSYEARLARLQLGFDRVNDELRSAQKRFGAIASDLEAKHRVLAGLIHHKEALRASLDGGPAAPVQIPKKTAPGAPGGVGGGGPDSVDPPAAAERLAPGAGGSSAVNEPDPDSQEPHASATGQGTGGLFGSAMHGFAAIFRKALHDEDVEKAPLRRIAEIEARLTELYPAQETLLAAAEADVDADEAQFVRAIKATGIDPRGLIAKVRAPGARSEAPTSDSSSNNFDAKVARTSVSMDRLTKIVTVLRSVPLTSPVGGSSFAQTSGFGGRVDPFSHEQAFHAGLDFSGPWGADVHVTAPGVVTFAGARGGYGNTVEVDHGYGIRTRYGHLSKILVRVGNTLEKGAVVGKLGSTGRSTGPHVHYEIWYNDAVRNPSRFLRAASYVHEK